MSHNMHNDSMSQKAFLRIIFSLCIVFPFLIGCAGPARSINMIPDSYEIENRHSNSVKLSVEGGKSTSQLERPQISNEEFMNALEESIKKSMVFSKIIKDGESEYLLRVYIDISQPTFGINMEVKLDSNWTLTDLKSKREVWRKLIETNHTATMGDAFVGITRLRIANEGAAKKTIQRGIHELSRLNLKDCC